MHKSPVLEEGSPHHALGKPQGQRAAGASPLHFSHCRAALRAGLGFQGLSRKTSSKGKQQRAQLWHPIHGDATGSEVGKVQRLWPRSFGPPALPLPRIGVFPIFEGRSSMLAVDTSTWAMLPEPIPKELPEPIPLGTQKRPLRRPKSQPSLGF